MAGFILPNPLRPLSLSRETGEEVTSDLNTGGFSRTQRPDGIPTAYVQGSDKKGGPQVW